MRPPDISPPVEPGARPTLRFPSGATDCHAHVFGPQARYRLLPETHFVPHESPMSSYATMLHSIGCERAVLIQPSVYGTDNAAIEDALQEGSSIELRAVAVVAPDVDDRELERLHMLGFRGIRINVAAATRGLGLQHARPLADRIRQLGWHLQVFADFLRQPEVGEVLAALPVPIVIDHFGRINSHDGVESAGFRALLRLLEHENCWAKLSAPYFVSKTVPGYPDVAPFARAMVSTAPERIIWGTDWPHPSAREYMPRDADLADALGEWVPNEVDLRNVLVNNPARLYGFPTHKFKQETAMLIKKLHMGVVGLALAISAAPIAAQPYPTRPVRLIVGFAPGGGTDLVARVLAQKLNEVMGQPFVVENRAGATGTIGAKAVATAPPDGYTLLMGHVNSQAIAPALAERPPYDSIKDFASVAYIGYVPNVLVVNPASAVSTVAQLIAKAKSQPNGLSFASPGIGSTNHLAGEMLRAQTGANFVHVPYKGSGPAMVDLLGGQIDLNFDAMSSALPSIKSGRLRALAVTSPKRDPDLPDVPTMSELGFKTFDITNWYGVVAPANTPAAIINALHVAIKQVLQMPDVASKLAELGTRREDMTTQQFSEFTRTEFGKYRDFAKSTGVRLEQ